MNYCTYQDIEGHVPLSRLIEVTDDTHPNQSGSVQMAVVEKAIGESSSLIDSYIGKRFTLPLPCVPDVLKNVCVDLAIYNLYERVTEMNVTEGMILRYKNAIKLLEGIAAGELSIGIAATGISESAFKTVSNGNKPLFTMESMSF